VRNLTCPSWRLPLSPLLPSLAPASSSASAQCKVSKLELEPPHAHRTIASAGIFDKYSDFNHTYQLAGMMGQWDQLKSRKEPLLLLLSSSSQPPLS
jgi:hypothetical protein